MSNPWIEAIGYVGSGLVLISMLMSSVVKLRIINLAGSAIFTVYALLIRSYPTALMNVCLVGINLYHLLHMSKPTRHFDVYEDRADSAWLAHFLPDFRAEDLRADARVFAVMRDSEAAGVLIGVPEGDGLTVALDYATPVYRDCSVGTALYAALPASGVHALTLHHVPETHAKYIERMGFTAGADGSATRRLD